jgi:hypothetical protein
LRAPANERVRIVAELAVERNSFAGEFGDVAWHTLPPVPLQHPTHRLAFERVAREIGISKQMRPASVVKKMVEYFRSFAPSDEPVATGGDIYLDLALSKKGVCRHRAFAFLVTALNIGIPARLVHNEAHAWVEVQDDRMWRRIDLGGAALNLDDEQRLDRPQHVPPPDPFAWPTGRDGGGDLAHRARQQAQTARDAANPGDAARSHSSGALDPGAAPDPNAPVEPAPAGSELVIEDIDRDIFRGKPMRLRGRIRAAGSACAHVRVDVLIHGARMTSEQRIGSLSTDELGVYDGEVVLPRDIPVGDYELVVATPGNKNCGAGRAK